MSRTFDINCHDCKESLWIGQRDHIYTGKEYLTRLNDFLFKHQGHSLTFGHDSDGKYIDYENFETMELEPNPLGQD